MLLVRRVSVIVLPWVSLAGSSCARVEAPKELHLEVPALITSKQPVIVHARSVQRDGSVGTPSGELDFKLSPPDLGTIGKSGMLSCSRSGDGEVSLNVAGTVGRAKFGCKLVARIEGPAKITLDASLGEREFPFQAVDAAGQQLEVPLSVVSDLTSVVQARGGRLVPGNVGVAKLSVRAGDVAQAVQVEVVRSSKVEAVPIDQNRRISFSIEPGKYRLVLRFPTPQRVSVEWLGAPYCQYRGEGSQHQVDCTLQRKGSVSFDNPAYLLRGEKTPSVEGVTLLEVP
jgi:hypothetical protein